MVDSFIRTHPDKRKKKIAHSIEIDRKNIKKEDLIHYFDILKEQKLNEIDPSLILNIDESGFGQTDIKKKNTKPVIVPMNIDKSIFFPPERDFTHESVICCITADGDFLKPGLIGLNKSLPIDLFKTTFYNNIYYYYSKIAFINSIIFKYYIFSEIIPYVKKRRSEMENHNARSVLLFDGHLTHVHQEVKQFLSFEGIECIVFPPHSSHITQPLFQSCFVT